ncbi:MAG TPA: pantetheine-phosphate adenylyltransferase [Planctomycetota bacterium]|nr:pantetheine-phosphate adenylyltransferase [Planctomycetota bacterium]
MERRAVYPGSFDPVTYGHLDLVRRGAALFDELVVAIGVNAEKRPTFDAEERREMVARETVDLPNVRVDVFPGLVVDFARRNGLKIILRGLRTVSDFEAEFQMALTNRSFAPELETVFVMPGERWSYISSRLIKEIVQVGGDVERFVPPAVARALIARLKPGVDAGAARTP